MLPQGYEVVKLQVASGTQLSTRAADVTKNLSQESPVVVCLSTKSRNANKLISVVEIAKRELTSNGINVFQYNVLSSEALQIERKQPDDSGPADANCDAGDDSDDAFETMVGKIADGPKQRVIPVMTTYLSTTSIEELRTRYNEQR